MRWSSFALAIVATSVSAPAIGCSWPANFFETQTKGALLIQGEFKLRALENTMTHWSDTGAAPEGKTSAIEPRGRHGWSTTYVGDLSATDGKTYRLRYEFVTVVEMCTPFTRP